MPYIDKTPVESVKRAIDLWQGVMHDPNLDGYNGFACFKKIMEVKWHAEKALLNVPPYHELEKWVEENEPEHRRVKTDEQLAHENKIFGVDTFFSEADDEEHIGSEGL